MSRPYDDADYRGIPAPGEEIVSLGMFHVKHPVLPVAVDNGYARRYDTQMPTELKFSKDRDLIIGIGTTFDYSIPFEPMCRMIAQAGFKAITIGGGDTAHSGYETEEGRTRIRLIVNEFGLNVDSIHAPFGPECDLSMPDIQVQATTNPPDTKHPTPDTDSSQPEAQESSGHIGLSGPLRPMPVLPGGQQSTAPDSQLQASDIATRNLPLPPRFVCKSSPARLAAVARVKNAIDAAMALDCQIVIIHPAARSYESAVHPDAGLVGQSSSSPTPDTQHPTPPSSRDDFPVEQTRARIHALRDSLSELIPYARHRNVRLALENLPSLLSMQVFEAVLDELPELGVCYDSSHAQISTNPFGVLQRYRDRIIATHISDNHGSRDDHILPFEGVIDWEEFAFYFSKLRHESEPLPPSPSEIGLGNPKSKIQNPKSSCGPRVFMLEVEVRESAFKDTREFLSQAFKRAQRLMNM